MKVLNGTRILVIDDEPDARKLVELVLRREGATVQTAESVSDALRELEAFIPHIVVCDLSMPGEDGYSFIRRVRSNTVPGFQNIPAVALTAFTDPAHRQEALEAGFHAFVGKPFHLPHLVYIIDHLRKSRRTCSATNARSAST